MAGVKIKHYFNDNIELSERNHNYYIISMTKLLDADWSRRVQLFH